MEGNPVNLDELDYLAKRLDSFDVGEAAQFQAMAEKLNLNGMTDLINLTFCCQQAMVITDFTDLEAVGRNHYMNLNGGCASTEDHNNLDGYFEDETPVEIAVVNFAAREIRPLVASCPWFTFDNYAVDCDFEEGGKIGLLIDYCPPRFQAEA